MKQLLLLFLLFSGVSLLGQNAYQDRVRQLVREKLEFYYIDDPTRAEPGDFGNIKLNKNAIAEGRDIESPLWTNAANRGLRQLVVKLLRSSANGGDPVLQRITKDALLITNKSVNVYLYNDSANAIPHNDWLSRIYCRKRGNVPAEVNHCWPCASFFNTRTFSEGGHMALGASYFKPANNGNASGAKRKIATFLHELVHTQLKAKVETSASANRYGAVGTPHYNTELLPSKNTAFNEGVASSFSFRYHLGISHNVISWLNTNRRLFVDDLPGCGGSGAPSYRCLSDRLLAAGVTGTPVTIGGTAAKYYSIRNVPPEILVHNETVLANMIYEYTRQFRNPLMLVRDLKRAHSAIGGTTGDNFTFLPLYKEMLQSTKRWQSLNTDETQASRGEIFLAGITDFYLGYGMNDRPRLERSFGFTWSNDLPSIDDYFTTHRSALHGMRHDSTTWAQIQLSTFGERLNIHQPRSVSAAGQNDGNRP